MADPITGRRWATLAFKDGTRYRLTDEDMIWTARAVVYEGGPADVTLWTLVQRFSQLRGTYSSFAGFVQAFSQPVNPAWSRTGRFCRPGGAYANGPYCSEAKLQRRQAASTSDWYDLEQLDPAAVQTTIDWGLGLVPNPVPGATNFADPTVAQQYLDNTPGAELLLADDNWYLQEPWAANWGPDHVRILGSGQAPTATFARLLRRAVAQPWPWRQKVV